MADRVVFLSNHVYQSRRRAGFHELAGAFAKGGWQVDFVTTGISYLSILRGDRRLQSLARADFNTTVVAPDGVNSHAWVPLVHPVRTHRLTEKLEGLAFGHYGRRPSAALEDILTGADIVVFESNPSLFLFDAVKRIAPAARTVYRISDDVRVIPMTELIRRKEDEVIAGFDLLSVPSSIMLSGRFSRHRNARHHPHGIADSLIEGTLGDPFASRDVPKVVSVGSTLFDHGFLRISVETRPDLEFHVVGDIPDLTRIKAPHVVYHGEVPFLQAAAYSAHADIAIAAYDLRPGSEYLAETSNKLIQYTHFRKRVIAPRSSAERLKCPNIVPYDANDPVSIARSYEAAMALDPTTFDLPSQPRWTDVRDMIVSGVA